MEHHRQPGKRRFGIWLDWLVSGLILIGGILCGWGAGVAFVYVVPGLGVDARDWIPWWGRAHITFAHFVGCSVVLAAAYYWFRRRPSDSDPGA